MFLSVLPGVVYLYLSLVQGGWGINTQGSQIYPCKVCTRKSQVLEAAGHFLTYLKNIPGEEAGKASGAGCLTATASPRGAEGARGRPASSTV